MHWEAIGAASELVGAIAVVATLVYLTIQIRLSRQAGFTPIPRTVELSSISVV